MNIPKTPYQRRQLRDSLGVSFRFSRQGFHMFAVSDTRMGYDRSDTEEHRSGEGSYTVGSHLGKDVPKCGTYDAVARPILTQTPQLQMLYPMLVGPKCPQPPWIDCIRGECNRSSQCKQLSPLKTVSAARACCSANEQQAISKSAHRQIRSATGHLQEGYMPRYMGRRLDCLSAGSLLDHAGDGSLASETMTS